MAMALGSPDGDDDAVISTINTTPLVDVMLVLLIIFLITSPIVVKTVQIKLPVERNQALKTKPENITIEINKEGDVYWSTQKTLVAVNGTDDLLNRLKEVSVQVPQPEVHIRADQKTQYSFVGKTILTAQRAGIAKVSFITDPQAQN
ncbi:MAG TPA: biopolymer transporter ExbD [Burkholderiaceae bacterium]|jgi:biopolymer transport protein ExbD|nr:biopolymer transporter ExbD [Burkholderiaceae bacterium]